MAYNFNVEGRAPDNSGNRPLARYQIIRPGYFDVVKMALRRGRALTEQDTASTAQVVVVNMIDKSVAPRRFNMVLLGLFALIALVLAATGIFGVMSFTVAQRKHEIGIRIALGAQKGDILKLVVGQGMLLTLIGIILGLGGAFALTRWMSSLLVGVSATDPVVFGGIAMLLAAVAFIRRLHRLLHSGAARNEARPGAGAQVRMRLIK
jgi:hypothetical protein